MSDEQVEAKIVEAVFTSANTGEITSGGGKSPLAKLIEQAMAQTADWCYSNNITDPEKMREHMLAARAEVKKRYALAVEEAMRNLER